MGEVSDIEKLLEAHKVQERMRAGVGHTSSEPSDYPVPPRRVQTQPEWPPKPVQGRPGDGNPPSYPPPHPASVARAMAPWIGIFSAIAGAGGWLYGAGRKSAEAPTRDELHAVASSDLAAKSALTSELQAIREQIASMKTKQEDEAKAIDDIKADVRELRATAGVRVTSPGHR